jgi:hypothetical protein
VLVGDVLEHQPAGDEVVDQRLVRVLEEEPPTSAMPGSNVPSRADRA